MRYRVSHLTKYVYTATAPACQNRIHLAPRDAFGQRALDHQLLVVPEPSERRWETDLFGNRVDYIAVHQAHHGLTVKSTSLVDVDRPAAPLPGGAPWEQIVDSLRTARDEASLEASLFAFPSDLIRTSGSLAAFAAESFARGRDVVDGAFDLMTRVHRQFKYAPGSTNVSTPVEEVLFLRTGVCQDFAHVVIAALRSLGLAARYVSGYLRTYPPPGKPRLVGADASHAWLSVYCGPAGWVDLDPTNGVVPAGDHVTVAYGRDYADVCPIQGVFIGGGDHAMTVSVDVEPIDA